MTNEQKAKEILFEVGIDNPDDYNLSPIIELLGKETGLTEDAMRDAVKGMAQLAHVVSNYYLELKRSGFNEDQASELTGRYQTAILTMNTGSK